MAFLSQRKLGRIAAIIILVGGAVLIILINKGVFVTRPQSASTPSDSYQSNQSPPAIVISSRHPEQGDTLVLKISGQAATTAPSAALDGRTLAFFRWHNDWLAIAGIDSRTPAGLAELSIQFPSGAIMSQEVTIERRFFATTELKLPEELVLKGVRPEALRNEIIAHDNQTLAKVFAEFSPKIEFGQAFGQPLNSWVDVGGFGVIRKSGSVQLRHLGVDLQSETGDAIYAVNDGLVSFAGQLENFGTSVVINHGLGIQTAYLHLDKSMVKVGDRVFRGEIIGEAGSSGKYVLAPHLHFSVKIIGVSVDPRRFIEITNRFLK